jgi:hypothetical protein
MRLRAAGRHELVAHPPRERQVRDGPMQVSELPAAEAELNAAEPGLGE